MVLRETLLQSFLYPSRVARANGHAHRSVDSHPPDTASAAVL